MYTDPKKMAARFAQNMKTPRECARCERPMRAPPSNSIMPEASYPGRVTMHARPSPHQP